MMDIHRPGMSIRDLRARALDGSLFAQRSRNTRERIWDALHRRYIVAKPEWVLSDFRASYSKGPQSREFVTLLYLHYALRDRLTFDLVTGVLWDRWIKKQFVVSRDNVLFLLDQASEAQPHIGGWSEKTRLKLAGSILTAIRDFGILKGTQRKVLVQPTLPPSTAEHLLRILTLEGVRGADVLRDVVWRLFLCREEEVAGLLHLLAQNRRIRFERTGHTVVLDTPEEWSIA